MEKRLLIALALAAVVILLSQKLFPAPAAPTKRAGDTTAVIAGSDSTRSIRTSHDSTAVPEGSKTSEQIITAGTGHTSVDTISLSTPKATYHFTSIGAVPLDVVLSDYHKLPKGSSGNVIIGRPHIPLFSYALVNGRDTLQLNRVKFTVDSSATASKQGINFKADVQNTHIAIEYSFTADGYLGNVHGTVNNADSNAVLLVRLHQVLPFVEADSSDDLRSLAYVTKPVRDDARSIAFAKLDSLEPKVERDSLTWVASKNKYFLLALIATPPGRAFTAAIFTRGPHEPKNVSSADALIIQPLTHSGVFGFEMYTGPQEWRRLHQMGHK